MKVLQETTKWKQGTQPNHVYLVDGDKMLAYQPWGTGTVVHFDRALRFDQARRKFSELAFDHAVWGGCAQQQHVVHVAGSNGAVYTVDTVSATCTCTGFRYRGSCKHLAIAAQESNTTI